MAGQVYFGNANFQTFIVAPQSGMTASSSGYSATTELLNGRSFVKRSFGASRKFNASWIGPMNSTDMSTSLQTIKDFADGFYGNGKCFWLDPYAVNQNVMPTHWASPALAEYDWPAISATVTPTFNSLSPANGFPSKLASYVLPANHVDARKLTIIIPSTHTLHIGWHASAAGISASSAAGIRMAGYNISGSPQSAVNPVSLLTGGTTRTNQTFSGSTTSRVEIYLANGGGSSSTVLLSAIIAQVLPTGTSVASGGFIDGKGTTALQFAGPLEIEYYSSAVNSGQIGLSTTFVEVD
jgi:hypothetical protein